MDISTQYPQARELRLQPRFGKLAGMHWIYLTLAIFFEVAGATCMKLSSGFARVLPTILMAVFYGCRFCRMTLAIKRIDVSVAYAV